MSDEDKSLAGIDRDFLLGDELRKLQELGAKKKDGVKSIAGKKREISTSTVLIILLLGFTAYTVSQTNSFLVQIEKNTVPSTSLTDWQRGLTLQLRNVTLSLANITSAIERNTTPVVQSSRSEYGAVYHQLGKDENYSNWHQVRYSIPTGSTLHGVSMSLSVADPKLHVQLMLVDGEWGYTEVIDDRSTRGNVLAVLNCAGTGTTGNVYVDLAGRKVADVLYLAVWSDNLDTTDHVWGFHGTCVVYYGVS